MTFGASLASAISIEETHPPYRFLENPISIEKAHRGNMEYGCHPSQLLSALGLYDLPFGANRRFHFHSNRIAYLAPGGWSVSAVSLWETGPYLKPTRSSNYGPGNLSLSYRGGFSAAALHHKRRYRYQRAYVQINAFNTIPSGPVGKCGVGILVRPGTCTIAGLSKTFPSHGAFSFAL